MYYVLYKAVCTYYNFILNQAPHPRSSRQGCSQFLVCTVSVCLWVTFLCLLRFWYPLIKRLIMDGFQSLRCLWKCQDKTPQSIMLKLGMYGYVWINMGIYGYVWVYMGMYGSVWVYMGMYSIRCYCSLLYCTVIYCTVMSVCKYVGISVCQYLMMWVCKYVCILLCQVASVRWSLKCQNDYPLGLVS